jgi:hypothetical protein
MGSYEMIGSYKMIGRCEIGSYKMDSYDIMSSCAMVGSCEVGIYEMTSSYEIPGQIKGQKYTFANISLEL